MSPMFHKAWEWESRSLQLRSPIAHEYSPRAGPAEPHARRRKLLGRPPDCSRKCKLLDDRAKKAEFGNEESRHMES